MASNYDWLKKIFKKSVEGLFVSSFIFIIAFIILKIFFGFSYDIITEESIKKTIKNEVGEDLVFGNRFEYVDFDGDGNSEIVVLSYGKVNDILDENDDNVTTSSELQIFKTVNKTFLHDILSSEKLYTKWESKKLEQPSDNGFWYRPTYFEKTDILDDGKEEIFFCLSAGFGITSTFDKCMIYDGIAFYNFLEIEDNSYNCNLEGKRCLGKTSDDMILFEDKTDQLFVMRMIEDQTRYQEIFGENKIECHSCPHLFLIYQYKFYPSPTNMFMSTGTNNNKFVLQKIDEFETPEKYRGNPTKYIYENYLE